MAQSGPQCTNMFSFLVSVVKQLHFVQLVDYFLI